MLAYLKLKFCQDGLVSFSRFAVSQVLAQTEALEKKVTSAGCILVRFRSEIKQAKGDYKFDLKSYNIVVVSSL